MSLQPRPYQVNAVDSARRFIARGRRRVLLVAPTGAGKTVCATMIVEGAISKQRRVLVLAHRAEIIDQTSAKLDAIGVDHGIIQANHWRKRAWCPVQVASVPTLTRRLARKPEADVVILDESHHVSAQSFRAVIDSYPEAILIGLTATPYRTDGRALGDVFEELIVVAQVRELIDQGFLVQPRFFAPFNPDLSGVHTTAGDFNQHETQDLMNRPKLIGDIVANWQAKAAGLTTVCFASGVAHSVAIRDRFREAGIDAAHLDANTPAEDRKRILGMLRDGQIQVLSNVGILTEGWDLPGCSCAILARPTESKSLHNQMIGRVLRASPGKPSAIVLDHAGNTIRHGFPTDHQEFSLDGREKRTKEALPSVRICKQCYAAYPARLVECPECGWKPETKQVDLVKEAAGELVEVTPDKRTGVLASEREKARLLAKWRATAEARGYKPGWASVQFKTLFLTWPASEIEAQSKLIGFPAFLVYEGICKCGGRQFACDESMVSCRACGESRWKVPPELRNRALAWMATRARADEQLSRMAAESPA